MKVKGNKVSNAAVCIKYMATKKLSEDRVERGDRGSATVKKNEVKEDKGELITFNPGSTWTEVRKEFTVKFDSKDLADLDKVTNWSTTIAFSLSQGQDSGNLYIDDVKVIEK